MILYIKIYQFQCHSVSLQCIPFHSVSFHSLPFPSISCLPSVRLFVRWFLHSFVILYSFVPSPSVAMPFHGYIKVSGASRQFQISNWVEGELTISRASRPWFSPSEWSFPRSLVVNEWPWRPNSSDLPPLPSWQRPVLTRRLSTAQSPVDWRCQRPA